jgi:hypothetical protein
VTCDDIRPKLTAYLEGELEGDRGTVVRGHLRTCEECRVIAAHEARLRDELRALPTVDPPASLWAGVQARLAQEEVAESNLPSWRRFVARLGRLWSPAMLPRAAVGGLLVAATILIVAWRLRPEPTVPVVVVVPSPKIEADVAMMNKQPRFECPTQMPPETDDVSDDLALDAIRTNATLCQAVAQLDRDAPDARTRWTATEAASFDTRMAELRAAVNGAPQGLAREKALRKLVSYMRSSIVREPVVLASIGGAR